MSKDVKLTPKTILFSCLGSIFVFVIIIIICIYAIGRSVPDETSNQENTISQQSEANIDNTENIGNSQIMELLQSTYYVTGNITDVKIEYDNSEGNNIYIVSITGEGVSLGMQEVRNGYQQKNNWTELVENTQELANSTYQQIKLIDSTANLIVNIMNDLNTDNALIIVMDGVLFYDALNSYEE